MYYDPKKIAKLCPSKRQIEAMEEAVQYMSERKQRRFANFKIQVEKFWQLYPWLRQSTPTAKNDQRSLGGGGSSSSHHSIAALGALLFVVCVTLMSCRSQQIIVPNDSITQTQTKTKTIQRDSIFERDSIFVTQWIKGDTVYNDRWHTKYKFLSWCRIDTFIQHDTTTIYQPVEVEKEVRYVPAFYKWCAAILLLLVICKIIRIMIKYLI